MDNNKKRFKIVVTGGSGYVGFHIAKALSSSDSNSEVVIYDTMDPPCFNQDNLSFVKGDICDRERLFGVLEDADGVVHAAGFGLSGEANLPAYDDVTVRVNVEGTRNVVEGCRLSKSVKALVFSSTVNIRFNTKEIVYGREEDNDDLADDDKLTYIDEYSRTKHVAEKMVIAASSFSTLRTCALRLGGIYGPGERMMIPKSMSCIRGGLLDLVGVSSKDLLIDFLFVDNAVQAHVKALHILLDDEAADLARGEVFYITDGHPRPLHFMLEPLYSFLRGGKKLDPWLTMPPCLMVSISYVFHYLSRLLGKRFRLPFWGLTPMESYKMTVSHYFCIDKARLRLGYDPVVNEDEWTRIVQSYHAEDDKNRNRDASSSSSEINKISNKRRSRLSRKSRIGNVSYNNIGVTSTWFIAASFLFVVLAAISL